MASSIAWLWLLHAASLWGTLAGSGAVFVPANDSTFRLVGRFERGLDGFRFDMNGCEIQFRVQGATKVMVRLAQRISPSVPGPLQPSGSQVNDFVVFIDGNAHINKYPRLNCSYCTFDTTGAKNDIVETYVLAEGISEGTHDIRIVKSTEPQWTSRVPAPNWMTFHGVVLDAGQVLAPAQPRPQRRLEFVGDSITAGYCNLCAGPSDETATMTTAFLDETSAQPSQTRRRRAAEGGPWEEAFVLGWPYQICEALGAECHTAAWSGFGMIENCCGGNTTMPEIWQRTLATDSSSHWNFSAWIPHGLVINLGTNDNLWAKNASYTETYFEMVLNASKAYGPNLEVFLACGPMITLYCPYVEEVIVLARAVGIRAHFFDQRGFLNGTYGPRCCGHPSVPVDAAMAKHGADFIGKTLGWTALLDQSTSSEDHVYDDTRSTSLALAPTADEAFDSLNMDSLIHELFRLRFQDVELNSAAPHIEPNFGLINQLIVGQLPRLNSVLQAQLPMSVGDCSSSSSVKAPSPCRGNGSLYSVHVPWKYEVIARWVAGLRTLELTSVAMLWNETGPGVSVKLQGVFRSLSASIYVAECITFDHCRKIWDNTDACCGENIHFEIDVVAICGGGISPIQHFAVQAVRLDEILIREKIFGFKFNAADLTGMIQSEVSKMLRTQLFEKPLFPGKSGSKTTLADYLNQNQYVAQVASFLCASDGAHVASNTCLRALEAAPLEAKGLMFFAMGKQAFDQGAYEVCTEIPKHSGLESFSTKHFTVSFTVHSVPGEIGVCLPAVCKNADIQVFVDYLYLKEPLAVVANIQLPSFSDDYPQPKGTIRHPNPVNNIDDVAKWHEAGGSPVLTSMALGLLFALLVLVVFSTRAMQKRPLAQPEENNLIENASAQAHRPRGLARLKLIQAFSLVGPDGTWTTLWQCPRYRPTDCLNGLRVISMLWIILGHSLAITGGTAGFFDPEDVAKTPLNPDAAATTFAWTLLDMPGLDLAVDTFFFISGFLASFVGSNRSTPFVKGAVLRYLRLAPCLAFAMMLYTLIVPFAVEGPFAPRLQNSVFRRCHAWTWWTPLLFIMNFLPWYNDDVCMGWTWYLGNDMIFAIFGILVLNLWKWSARGGWALALGTIVSSFAVTFWLVMHYKLSIYMDVTGPHGADYQYYLYDKPWSRIPAFLVGMVVPWLLSWARNRYGLERGTEPRSSRARCIAYSLFLGALGVLAFLLFIAMSNGDGGYGSSRIANNWTEVENAMYITFARPLWACAHAVIALLCFFDYIPFVNGFLSHWLWTPLTRLTYNAYLLHPIVVNWRCGLATQYYQFTVWTVLSNWAVDSALAYAAAVVVWCLVEKPVAALTTSLFPKSTDRKSVV